jgi:CRISPR/Cas system-associated exonuclease Cas4 (RecB family)
MTLSYSALKQFETCPRQYHEVRVLKKHPPQETEATIWGKKVHEAAELYVRDNAPLVFDFPGQDMVRAVADLKGEKHCELEMAVNDKLEAVAFDDPTAVLRGIADVVVINGITARVLDYKTGSDKYPDVAQLELMALMVFAKFPEVEKSHGALLFLKCNNMVQKITKREDSQRLWAGWFSKLNRVESAHEVGVWNPKSSGLCAGWCVVETCEHWKPRRKK